MGAGGYFFRKFVSPALGKPIPQEMVEETRLFLLRSLDLLENYWLKDTPFLCGSEITIADIACACEVDQTRQVGIIEWEKYPRLKEWLDRMLAIPEFKFVSDKGQDGLKGMLQLIGKL